MKRRLRKKLHCGEFKVFGVYFEINFINDLNNDIEKSVDNFLDFLEDNKCWCGGNGGTSVSPLFKGFIELGTIFNNPMEKLDFIKSYLIKNHLIERSVFGGIVDAWYGPILEEY